MNLLKKLKEIIKSRSTDILNDMLLEKEMSRKDVLQMYATHGVAMYNLHTLKDLASLLDSINADDFDIVGFAAEDLPTVLDNLYK